MSDGVYKSCRTTLCYGICFKEVLPSRMGFGTETTIQKLDGRDKENRMRPVC